MAVSGKGRAYYNCEVLLAVRNFALGNLAGGLVLALIDSSRSGSFASESIAQTIACLFEIGMFFLVLAVYRVLFRKRGNFTQPGLSLGLGVASKLVDWTWTAAARIPYVNYILAPVLAAAVFILVARRLRANAVGH